MAVEVKQLKRIFTFKDETLPDPDPSMSIPEVLDFYSGKYPELTAGKVGEPEIDEEASTMVYDVSFNMGDKG